MPRLNAVALLCLATLCGTAFAQAPHQASPGIVNFVEGQASIDGRPLPAYAAGSTVLHANQYIATGSGKAEILLTPGVFIRLGEDSTLQMVAADSTHTEVRLERGRADIEANVLTQGNNILIDTGRGQTHLLEHGLYSFDENTSTLRVFDGKAAAYPGVDLTSDIKPIDVKGGHQLSLAVSPFKTQRFDRDKAEDALYDWGNMRSASLGRADFNLSESYAASSSYNSGWYWAGGPYGYTWFGAGLYSPYGYGFYSPLYYGGGYGYGYGGGLGFYGGGFYRGGGYGGGFYRGGGFGGIRGPAGGVHPGGGMRGGGGGGRRG